MGLPLESILNIAAPTATALIVFGLTIFVYYLKDRKIYMGLQKALEREIYHNIYGIIEVMKNAEYINNNPLAEFEDWLPITNILKYYKPTFWAFEAILKESGVSSLGKNVAELFSFYCLLKDYDGRYLARIADIEEVYYHLKKQEIDDGIFVNLLNERILSLMRDCQVIVSEFNENMLKTAPFLSQKNWEAFKEQNNAK